MNKKTRLLVAWNVSATVLLIIVAFVSLFGWYEDPSEISREQFRDIERSQEENRSLIRALDMKVKDQGNQLKTNTESLRGEMSQNVIVDRDDIVRFNNLRKDMLVYKREIDEQMNSYEMMVQEFESLLNSSPKLLNYPMHMQMLESRFETTLDSLEQDHNSLVRLVEGRLSDWNSAIQLVGIFLAVVASAILGLAGVTILDQKNMFNGP